MPSPSDLLAELDWRGLVQQGSEGLPERLAKGPISGYIGFDASAQSLHVGHLLQVFLLTHLQLAGGRPVVLIGGGTGMIGDPRARAPSATSSTTRRSNGMRRRSSPSCRASWTSSRAPPAP